MAKFLVVDDSEVFMDLLLYTLEDAGFTDYDSAKNGKEGLELASKNDYRLIITDVHMPKMDGITMISKIRELANYKKTPILVISTEFNDEYKAKGKEAGANGWIVKPFIPSQLIKAVGICLPD